MGKKEKPRIPGGYYLKARKTQESEIAHAPPYIREIWDWLIKEANHSETKTNGKPILRGECVRTYRDIREDLSWFIGFRKMRYTKHQVDYAMRWLREKEMITTRRTTRGVRITICNYEFYQNPANYEYRSGYDTEQGIHPQASDTINKNGKNGKKKEGKKKVTFEEMHLELASLLKDEILKNNPNAKFTESQLKEWANDVRLMVERDDRAPADIKKMILWAQDNSFWKRNILSIKKLRKHFDRLTMEMGDEEDNLGLLKKGDLT